MAARSKPTEIKRQLKMKDVLEIFPVCRKTIERWCVREQNPMPHQKINGYYYFDPDDLSIWKEQQGNSAAS